MSASHITLYDKMPIPPVEEHTERFDAGVVSFGVEYRLLDDAIAAASDVAVASGSDRGPESFDDRGVSIHVYALEDGERLERLRFDCFEDDPHYHYVDWKAGRNEMLHLDPVADGDPVAWALERIRTRLPQMLARAGATQAAHSIDAALLDAVLPRVAEAAHRLRFDHDDEAVRAAALGRKRP